MLPREKPPRVVWRLNSPAGCSVPLLQSGILAVGGLVDGSSRLSVRASATVIDASVESGAAVKLDDFMPRLETLDSSSTTMSFLHFTCPAPQACEYGPCPKFPPAAMVLENAVY